MRVACFCLHVICIMHKTISGKQMTDQPVTSLMISQEFRSSCRRAFCYILAWAWRLTFGRTKMREELNPHAILQFMTGYSNLARTDGLTDWLNLPPPHQPSSSSQPPLRSFSPNLHLKPTSSTPFHALTYHAFQLTSQLYSPQTTFLHSLIHQTSLSSPTHHNSPKLFSPTPPSLSLILASFYPCLTFPTVYTPTFWSALSFSSSSLRTLQPLPSIPIPALLLRLLWIPLFLSSEPWGH